MATAHASHVSEEEENFLRMQMLTNISPKAVRVLFDKIDKKFHPSCLETTIKKEYAKLFDLKIKRVINAAQWNSLFPCYGAPTSKTFDVTLMVVLIKNLTNLTPPASGYDSLPSSTDFSHIADLARIKHYRNQQAHCEDGKINTALFITAWQDISGALGRLGGPAMYEECKELRTKHLDQTTVPLNVKVKFIQTMGQWRKHDTNFIETRAAKHVLKCVQENSCVTVTGSFGIGKTATLRHVVLKMAEEGYDVLLDTNPHDIIKFHNPNQKTLFVIDDFCGKYSLNKSDVNNLEPVTKRIQELVRNKRTKIIVACRLQVYKDKKFESLPIFRMKVCNLSSDDLCLSQLEKKSIAELYLETDTSEIISCCHKYDCFPLLCRLYHDNPERKNKDFFKNLSKVYEEEIEQFINNGHFGKYCALALCVIFNNQLPETFLIEEIGSHLRTRIENTCKECKLNKGTSRLFLLDELKSLENTFVKKEQGEYKTVHDNIFDFVSYYFRKKMIYCIIMNADCYFIMKRFLLKKKDDMDHSISIVPTEYHQMYIRRMICDWYNGYLFPVFNNINMDLSEFIRTFFDYLTALDIRVQSQLAKSPEGPALVYCCSKGYIPFVEWCLYHDADVNLCTFDGLSPVFVSSQNGHLEILKILLDNKADTNICGPSGKSPLYMACQNGHRDIVKLLLANKADIDKCSADKLSPLFIACQQNYVDIATLLLDNKADINKYADDGTSALHIACSRGYTDIVKLLLHNKANVNARATRGASPLFAACMTNHNHANVDMINLLLHNKADVNKCIDNEASPLYIACQNGLKDTVKLLLENKADINKCTNTGKSPLFVACLENYVDIVKLLLNSNANINKCTDDGISPLCIACHQNYVDIVTLLLDNKADVDKYTDDGRSALHVACSRGYTGIVKLLLHNKANVNARATRGASPLFAVCMTNHNHANVDMINLLLHNKADVNKCIDNEASPLYIACQNGLKDTVKLLLENKADINMCTNTGKSPLFIACLKNYVDIVKLLLNANADINKCTDDGLSPLYSACHQNYVDIVTLLLDNKADINKCTNTGKSPLFIACLENYVDIVKLLLNTNADINKCTDDGLSPLFIACHMNHIDIVKLLLDNNADIDQF